MSIENMIEQLENIIIPDSIPERRVLIEDKLKFYADHEVFCPAIDSNVKILSKSIDETCNRVLYYRICGKEKRLYTTSAIRFSCRILLNSAAKIQQKNDIRKYLAQKMQNINII